jgi:hypothetical protein
MADRYLTYTGIRDPKTRECRVTVHDRVNNKKWRLNLCHRLRNHSTAFEWGYSGSGPAQLALALMASHLEDEKYLPTVKAVLGLHIDPPEEERGDLPLHECLAFRFYQKFKSRVVSRLPDEGWTLTEEDIDRLIIERPEHASA